MIDRGAPQTIIDEETTRRQIAELHRQAWSARQRADRLMRGSRYLIRVAGCLRAHADALDIDAKRLFKLSGEGGA